MANQEHLAILKQGVEAWNRWRTKHQEDPNRSAVNLSDATLSDRNLSGANFRGANLNDANLHQANLSGAYLSGASLNGANLNGTDLSSVNLSDATLAHASLCGALLKSANLQFADLQVADLEDADLSDADLSHANLIAANLTETNLCGANLLGAYLFNANFFGTNFKRANLESCYVFLTKFAYCDLSEVKGLDRVRHQGPSTIGVDTIYKSNGKIPQSFLLGCGVPEVFIAEMHSLIDAVDGIQFYSCFISYSSEDEEFAHRVHGRMRDAHLRVWFAPEDIKGGKKLQEQIETAIRVYDKLLIVLSESSLQSEWVMTELRKARKAERQSGKRKLFPVRLVDFETLRDWECFDADSGTDLAVELREYFIPDFSNWKDHDEFEAAFSRLLKDLRAEERAK